MKTMIITGATSSIAQHCMRLWIQSEPMVFFLAGRDQGRLERIAADLKVRHPDMRVHVHAFSLTDIKSINAFVEIAFQSGEVALALIAQGSLPDQTACQQDIADYRQALEINALSPLLFAEAILNKMEQAQKGQLAILGSVAGDRGRKSNYIYGSAKGCLERAVEGMQHRVARQNIQITLIKPGPIATPMTTHLQTRGMQMTSVEAAAKQIVRAIARKKKVVYVPKKWRLIMGIVKRLPRFVFHRLEI